MSKNKIWFEVWGKTEHTEDTLLAKVKSEGLAHIIALRLRDIYKDVSIK